MTQQKRIYIQYNESENDVVTLAFRSKQSLRSFLRNKKCKPIYISYKKPEGSIGTKSQLEILSVLEFVDYILCKGGDPEI